MKLSKAMRRIAALILGVSVLAVPVHAISGEVPDHPVARQATDRITKYRLWAMHQVTPAYPPYTYELIGPTPAPVTAQVCLDLLRATFTAFKRPTEPEHTQIVMLLQWLSVKPDRAPDFAKWIGCWPTASASYVAWEKHTSTTRGEDDTAPPYWYRVWRSDQKSASSAKCLDLVRRVTGRRSVFLLMWYDVHPDAPPDREKQLGCFPSGFDPEDRNAR